MLTYFYRRQDLYKTGVTVHIMEPGLYRTDLYDFDDLVAEYRETWDKLSAECKEYYGREYGTKCRYLIGFLKMFLLFVHITGLFYRQVCFISKGLVGM